MEVNRDRIPLSFEAFLMVAAFIFSYAVVDVFYDNVAMPQYEVFLAEKEAEKQERESQQPDGGAQAAKADEDSKTSVWEVLNGFEQKITITLFLASLILLLYKFVLVIRDRGLLKIDFLDLPPGRFIDRGDALDYVHEIDSELPADLPKPFSKTVTPFRQSLVPRALRRALHRFNEDDSVGKEEISHTITAECEGELMKLESQLVTINYIAWAIPSVGFIGRRWPKRIQRFTTIIFRQSPALWVSHSILLW